MYMEKFTETRRSRVFSTAALAGLLALAMVLPSSASAYSIMEQRAKHGWVMARSMVLDENGQPILVEYNEQGDEISKLSIPSGYSERIDELEIVSARSIEVQQERYKTYLEDHASLAGDARLVSRQQALATFLLADNTTKVTIQESDLSDTTKSVLIAGQSSRLLADPDAVILQQYPFDLTQGVVGVSGATSVVLGPEGEIVATSPYTVGPRVGFYGDGESGGTTGRTYDPSEDDLYGPVSGVQVYMNEFVYPGAMTATDSEGRYFLKYNLPVCPPGGFEFTTDVWAKLNYTSFSPLGSSTLPYYLRRQAWDYCYAQINPLTGQLEQTPATNTVQRINFYVDVMFLTGKLVVENPGGQGVTVGDETRYEVFDPESTDNASPTTWYDFDNDGQADRAVIGRMTDLPDDEIDEPVFVADPDGDIQGIYFSSSDEQGAESQEGSETPAPDLVRQVDADRTRRLHEDTGLLTSISQADLQNTDVMVFRASTGELVLDRRGLRDGEVHRGEVAVGKDGEAGYRLMMRGPMDFASNIGGTSRRGTFFEDWATDYQLTEPFRSRDAFHLQPGEWVDIVAINRTTGYMGTARTKLESIGGSESNDLSIRVDTIKLRPPNLRIWAERDYSIDKGLTAGDKREGKIIGSEGAGLQSDQKIIVYSEWLDSDGSALPEGLSDAAGAEYGLTGRLAKVVDADVLQAAGFGGGEMAEFPISPGRQTQILQFKDQNTNPEHFYIHVLGKAKNAECEGSSSCAGFDLLGSDDGIAAPLDTRPRFITPFLTPHYDEQSHWLAYREYRRLLQEGKDPEEGESAEPTIDPVRPVPTYTWNHRPEYQFSRYGLEIDAINRVNIDPDTGNETSDDLYDTDTPVIGSSDDLIEVLYSLIGPEFDRLGPIDGGQDLILAVGEEETRIELGEDNTLRVDNLEHLAGLDPEDFLSMRLYLNQDAGNVLWEYAFEHLVLGTQLAEYDPSTGEPLYVSADDPRVPLEAMLIGYAGREDKQPMRVRWHADGGATLETEVDVDNDYGIFTNELTLPPNRGAVSNVSVELLDADNAKVTLPPVEVKAGEPASIEVDNSAPIVSAAGVDEATLVATIRDQHGNPVEAGTGVSFFVEGSLHVVETSGATDDDGRATLTLSGGDIAEAANVRITSGTVTANVPVTVKPLQVEFIDAEDTLFAGASDSFTVKVTDYQGNPVPDAAITLGSNYGFLSRTEVTTDASGEAVASITTPGSDGSGQITAQIGRSAWHTHAFEVVYPQADLRDLEVNNAMMVGDTDTAGIINHVRYDATLVNLPYKVNENIRALGDQGDTVTVHIGDFRDPNLAPIAAYYMNDVDSLRVADETGRYTLNAQYVTQASGTPMGGGRSLRFSANNSTLEGDKPSVLWSESAPLLKRPRDLGFSIDVKPTSAGGTLVDLGGGAQRLVLENSGRLNYQVRTSEGTVEVQSSELANNQWHRVAARYRNGQVELWVDGNLASASASGDIAYSTVAARVLEVGKGFDGQLNSLKWFDWQGSPVMTFADGSTSKTVTIGADKYTELTLASTGAMGADGSELKTQRVAVYTDLVHQYASLISRDAFGTLAGQYADTLDPNAPPINVAGLTPTYNAFGVASYQPVQPVSIPFIAQAHAADGESSFLWDLVNWFVPIEDFGIVLEQLGYLVSDPSKFDGMEFTIALINTITIFPPAKPLKLFTKPLRAMFRKLSKVNPKFTKHFAGYLGKVVQRAKKGDFDTLWNTLPFLVLAAELYNDEDSREGLRFLFSTVDSADDVLAWVSYLGLPADSWQGVGDPPTVPAFGNAPSVSQVAPLQWLIPAAHAASTSKITRISEDLLGRVLLHVQSHVGKEVAEDLPDALNIMRKALKEASARDIRQYVFSPEMLGVSAGMMRRAGSRALRNLVRGANNTRYSMAALLPMLAYLEYENTCGRVIESESEAQQDPSELPSTEPVDKESERLKCDGKGFDKAIRSQVYSKMRTAFADRSDRKLEEERPGSSGRFSLVGSGHGALFHLEQLAYYQAQYRLGVGDRLKASDAFRYVAFFDDEELTPQGGGQQLLTGDVIRRERYVDIVLEDSSGNESWYELKSYAAKSKAKQTELDIGIIGNWRLRETDSRGRKGVYPSLHRQFVIDRTAYHLKGAWLAKNRSPRKRVDVVVPVKDFQWKFQKFKVDNRRTKRKTYSPDLGGVRERGTIRERLARLPKYSDHQKDLVDVSMKLKKMDNMNYHVVDSGILSTLREVLPQLGYDLAKDVLEDVIVEGGD